MRPVPITSYSAMHALGASRGEIVAGLRRGVTALGPSPVEVDFETTVGVVADELPSLGGELAPWSTRLAQMAAALLQQMEPALTRARARWRPERIAVLLGTSTAGALHTEAAYQHYVAHGRLPDDYDFRRQHTYGALLHVVKALTGAAGPAWMCSTACSSSAKPLATAQRLIEADVIDAAIVGGIDTLCVYTLRGFHSLGALSSRPCRPFSEVRDGLSIGEGGALLLMEREGDARALLLGAGETSDAYHMNAPHPQGAGARAAMEEALAHGGCAPGDVDHVNAHGTGTRHNDLAESRAIEGLLGVEVPVASTKGYTGHTLGAAGAVEAVMSILAIEEAFVPASPGADPVDGKIPVRVATESVEGPVRRVLSNSFAFGGNNISLLLGAP